MQIAIIASVLVLLVAAGHIVAGWVYSSGFRKTALLPQEPTRAFGVWVRGITKGRIVLTTTEPRQDIGHPGILGVFWEGGYGQVGEVEKVEGFDFTRSFKSLSGTTPPVCTQPLAECAPVDLESYAYPTDPGDVGLEFEDVTYETPLGPAKAWIVPAKAATRWAIHVHGWTAQSREAIRLMPTIHSAGITSMAIDYRNDPGGPVDPTGHYRFGLSEWEDVEGAVRHALDHGAEDIVLVGYSTGGAHIMSFLERSDIAERVRATVMDSPNIILAETIRFGSRDMRFEPTPIRVTQLMLEFGMWIIDVRWKIDWNATNYVQRAEKILTMPSLVFHGTSDQRVPIAISRQLEARCPSTVTLIETQAAGHVMSWNADPGRYEGYLARFLDQI